MKGTFIFILTILCNYFVYAQNGLTQIGGRSAGMGYAYATEGDTYSLFNNPGGLGMLKETSALFAFENKYGVEGLNIMGAGLIHSLPFGTVGISAFRFGDDLYNEQTASLAFGNRFGIASLGVKVNYLQYNIESFGSKSIFTIDFGGIAEISEQLYFGAYIRNINQAQVSELQDERAATLLNAGLSYRPINKLRLNLETEKDIDLVATVKIGAEYLIFDKVAIRTGVSTEPFTNYGGLGFRKGKLQVDYAVIRDRVLGYSHQGSVVFKLIERDE